MLCLQTPEDTDGSCEMCEQTANLDCADCERTLYCGEAHRDQHAADHKDHCRAFEVRKNDLYGR